MGRYMWPACQRQRKLDGVVHKVLVLIGLFGKRYKGDWEFREGSWWRDSLWEFCFLLSVHCLVAEMRIMGNMDRNQILNDDVGSNLSYRTQKDDDFCQHLGVSGCCAACENPM